MEGFRPLVSGHWVAAPYGRGCGEGETRGVAVGLGVPVGRGVAVGAGVGVGVGVGVGIGAPCAQYLPPVLTAVLLEAPPQTII